MKRYFIDLLPMVSLGLGILAVSLSWKAFTISERTEERVLRELSRLAPDVVIGFAEPHAIASDRGSVSCTQRIRLMNEGSTPTSLVGFTLWVRDGVHEENYFTLDSSDEEASTGNPQETNRLVGIDHFYGWLSLDNFQTVRDQDVSENPLSKALLPIQIDAYTASDLRSTFVFAVDPSSSKELDVVNPDKSWSIVLHYRFYFASGQTLDTPEMQCFPFPQK